MSAAPAAATTPDTGAAGIKRRVLHTYKIYKPEVEGGIPAVISVLTAMAGPGIDNEVLTARRRGWFRRLTDGKTPVIAVSSLGDISSLPVAPSFPFWARARAKSNDIFVHHVPFPLGDLAIVAFGLPKSTALIVHWHGDIDGRPLLKRLLAPMFHRALARADAVVVSDEIMVANSPFLRRIAAKCIVIPYGIDTAFWRTLDDTARARVAALREKYPRLIVALGRLVPYKGYEVLLRAFARVDNARLIIIGDGPLRQELSELARALEIADRVEFAGRLSKDDAKVIVHAANVFVMPSNTIGEAFGLAQVEAMATGRPVVNTDLPTTVPKVARHNLEGLTVPPNDDVGLASALQTLLDDRALAARLGAAGQARAAAEYDQTKFVRRMENLYARLAAIRRPLS